MFGDRRQPEDFRDEVESHLALEADRLRQQGLSEEEALLAARRLFGNPTRARERFFLAQRGFVFGMIFEDTRFGLRMLRKNLGTTLLAALTLALALGANTAIFSVLNSAILQLLPVAKPQQLVVLTDPNASRIIGGLLAGNRSLLTYPEFAQLRDRMKTVTGLCAAQVTLERWPVRIGESSQELLRGRLVSENYFPVFAVKPAMGRFFGPDATVIGKDPYAVISYDLWQRKFSGSPEAIGTPLRLGKTSFEIIGVAPRGFRGETVGQSPDLWLPLLMQPLVNPTMDGLSDTLAGTNDKLMWLHVFGRRRAGVTVTQVQAEVSVLFRATLEASYPATMQPEFRREALQQNVVVKPLRSGVFHGEKEFAEEWLLLLALAGFVLLVACLNIANLLLARAAARSQEIAIRFSLGASRVRLISQFMMESLLLALLSGAGALMAAELFLGAILRMLSQGAEPFKISAELDPRVLAFSAAVTLLAGLLFGLLPAFRATANQIHDDLKRSGRGLTSSRDRMLLARALVVAQVALSLLLVTGAALFLRTLWNLQSFALGYPKENLLLLQMDNSNSGYQGARLHRLYRELAARMRDVSGIRAVSYSDGGLFSGFVAAFPLEIDGFTSHKEADRGSTGDSVAAGYFSTLQIPILLGREFEPRDLTQAPRVGVINEAFANYFFRGRNPLGKHFKTLLPDENGKEMSRRLEIVGVVRDARDQSLRGPIEPKFYVPGGAGWFEVRTFGDPSRVESALQKIVRSVDPDLSVPSSRTLVQILEQQNAGPTRIAQLATFYGAFALILAAIGVYGLLSYGVARRTNEIGIRAALGADRRRITGMILRETGALMAAGVVCGAAVTLAAARLFATRLNGMSPAGPRWSLARYEQTDSSVRLFGLTAMDPLTITAAAVLLFVLGLLAGYVPATRAALVDPAQALRNG